MAAPVQKPAPGDLYFFGLGHRVVSHVGFVTEVGLLHASQSLGVGVGAHARGTAGDAAGRGTAAAMSSPAASGRTPATTSATSTRRCGWCWGAARPALPARGARSRRGRDDDRPRARRRRRPRRRPAARRLAAHRRTRHRPPPGPQPARPGPRRARGAGPGLRRRVQGPGRRAVDPGRHRRAAARRQGARRLRRPPRPGPGAGRGPARPTSPTYVGGCRTRTGWWSRSTSPPSPRCWRRRCRPPPASAGTAPSTRPRPRQALELGAPRSSRGRRRAVAAHLRRGHPARPAARRRRPRALRGPGPALARDLDEAAAALDAGRVALGVVPSTDPAT